MPKFVIERSIPNAGAFKHAELQAISQKSCGVLEEMGTAVQWVHSYVTGDKIYCVYTRNEELVREHARRGGFPADSVARVASIIAISWARRASSVMGSRSLTWQRCCSRMRSILWRPCAGT